MYNFDVFVKMFLKSILCFENNNNNYDVSKPTVVHNILYRNMARESCSNRVYYYRKSQNILCSMTLTDDKIQSFTNHDNIDEYENNNDREVYF